LKSRKTINTLIKYPNLLKEPENDESELTDKYVKTIYIEHNKGDPDNYYLEAIPQKEAAPIVNRAVSNIKKA